MPFQRKKKDHVDPPVVETITHELEDHASEEARNVLENNIEQGQSAADPTAEPIQESGSEIVSTSIVEETVSVTDQSLLPDAQETENQSTTDTPVQAIEEQIVGGGDEFIQETPDRPLIETCESAVVGPPEAVAAALAEANVPGTALVAVKQEETAVVKKPIISERMKKTWGRSVKDPERKANLLLPGVSPDFAGDLVITVLVTVNPKLPGKGPFFRFAKYRSGMTVAEYVKACERVSPSVKVSHADLKWDVNHGYIKVAAAAEAASREAVEQAA